MKKKKVYEVILIISIVLLALIVRIHYINVESYDFIVFLKKWFITLKTNGGIFGLKESVGDYNAPYIQLLAILTYLPIKPLYSIKALSIIFDYLGAIFAGVLLYKFTKNKNLSYVCSFVILMLPTVVFNSSRWGQCDFIYTTFIILSLIFLVDDKPFRSFIFLGVAFAFKLQTIFILPIYILYYISERKFPIYYFLIIPIMDFILCIPSMLMRKTNYGYFASIS